MCSQASKMVMWTGARALAQLLVGLKIAREKKWTAPQKIGGQTK